MTVLLQEFLYRNQEPASQNRNPSFVLLRTVQNQQGPNPSKRYVQLSPSLRTPHLSTITLRELQQQVHFERVPCRPCTAFFFIQSLHTIVRDRLSQAPDVLHLQYFLSAKGRDH